MSNPLENFPNTLEKRATELENARNSLLSEIEDGVDTKPDSGWSIGEIAYHLHLVERNLTAGLKQTVASSAREERKPDEYLAMEWAQIAERVPSRKERIKAPEAAEPLNAPSLSETIKLLKESRVVLQDFIKSTTLDELASISMPHPVHTNMLISGLGWLSLLAGHDLRHLGQIKEIKGK